MNEDVKTFAGFAGVIVSVALLLGTPIFFADTYRKKMDDAHEITIQEIKSRTPQAQCTCEHCEEGK